MRKNHLIYLSLAIIAWGYPFSLAQAQPKNFSNGEDVAIAFYKTGGLQPNYSGWIEKSSPYQDTPWAKREGMMKEERARLSKKFNGYNPNQDDIIFRTKVHLSTEELQEEIEEDIFETFYFLNTEFVAGDDISYFPFEYAKEHFALMPFGMQSLTRTKINKLEFDNYEEVLVPNRAYHLIVRMRPKESVTVRPIEMDGEHRWVLKTDIASAEIWSHKGALLWEYTAPWYVSPELEKLQGIYDLKPTESNSKGSIKPFIRNGAEK